MAITIDNSAARIAIRALAQNQAAMQTSLQRLATGYRINTAKDDPAGLIASELLRSEQAQTAAAINNAQRADQVLATADGGLSEISNLLVNLQQLVVGSANTAGLSGDELAANQAQVDSILSTIDRLSNGTSFGGQKLLSGALAYQLSGGAGFSALHAVNVHSAKVPAAVSVEVMASAQHATLLYRGSAGGLSHAVNVAVAGTLGMIELAFTSAATTSAMAASINQFADSTGVTASAAGTDLAFISTGYGAAQFVSVTSNYSGALQTSALSSTGFTDRANGRDALVTIDGQTVEANGLAVTATMDGLSASFTLTEQANHAGTTATFGVTGGATFALAPHVDSSGFDSIGLGPIAAGTLGSIVQNSQSYTLADLGSHGAAALATGKGTVQQDIVNAALTQVSRLRGQIGAFRKFTIASEINSLNVTMENLSSAESNIRDTDFAAETAELTRRQILVAASMSALSAANQNQQIILKLLGQ